MRTVNIIGCGLAGLSAAVELSSKGIFSRLISLQPSERAQSVLAEGGINAALDTMGENDSPVQHFDDTVKSGAYIADPNAVWGLTHAAPDILKWLAGLGCALSTKDGRLVQRNFGGQKKKRTSYARSSTGKIIMTALTDEVRRCEAAGLVKRFSHHECIDVAVKDPGNGISCYGAKVLDTRTGEIMLFPGPVILACGGLNGFFPEMTTGSTANSGDLAAVLFAKGLQFSDLEFIQYHPTTVQIPGKRMLISEAARGEGGRLFAYKNGAADYFMENRYPELGNLMPRDVISKEMAKVVKEEGCDGKIWLDLTGLSEDIWKNRLSDMHDEISERLGIDAAKQPVPVEPGIHFFMGGIRVSEDHSTNIKGLFAAGEAACQYHGANRLGGNSMLAAIYGGRIAADSAIEFAAEAPEPVSCGFLTDDQQITRRTQFPAAKELRNVLVQGLGIERNGDSIRAALCALAQLEAGCHPQSPGYERLLLGKAMLLSALERKESRGAHFRTDRPDTDNDNFRKVSVSEFKDGKVSVFFEDIPGRRTQQ